MSTATQELELVAPDESAQVDNMKRADIGSAFKAFESEAAPILEQAKALVVTDASQLAVMKVADEYRKQIKKHRCAVEVRRKELVEGLNKQTSEINTAARTIREKFEEAEQHLLEISEFAEREIIRIEDGKRESRCAELKPFLTGPLSVDLGKISEEEYAAMLADARDIATLREERARKEKEAAEAKAKAEAEERERVRLENERLKKEAEEREAAARKEREETAERERVAAQEAADELDRVKREAAEKEQKERLKAAHEAKVAAEKARKEREAIEAEAAAERKKAQEEQTRRDAIAKQEREAAEARAREERDKFQAEAKRQREEREKIEAELAAKKAAEAKQEAEREAAAKAAALAPAKEKLMAFAKEVRLLALKTFSVPSVELITEVSEKTEAFAKWVEKRAGAL